MSQREHDDLRYEQVARIGKAVSSPRRLELLEVLAQGEKSVEQLAQALSIDVRPRAEFDHAHRPHARSMPLSERAERLAE